VSRSPIPLAIGLAVLLLTPAPDAAARKKPRPVEDFVQREVLALCAKDKTLHVLEATMDLPYGFDAVSVVSLRAPDGRRRGATPLLPKDLIRQLVHEGLKPLYDLERAERRQRALDALTARGCAPGTPMAMAGALDGSFVLGTDTYLIDVDVSRSDARFVVTLRRKTAEGSKVVKQVRPDVTWYAEGKRTNNPLLPREIVQVSYHAEARLLSLVLRSEDPPRHDVPAVDYLVLLPI
jgi:hypothetical protein